MAAFIDFLRTNFWHVAPILISGAFATAIILERARALIWGYPLRNSRAFFDKIRDLVMADRLAEAIAYCDQYKGKPSARVVREALLRAHQPEILIEDGLELAVSENGQVITKRTGFLATIANVATLLGLLGTIAGLIESFKAVGDASAQERAAKLANGISTAMNATMMGLAVAIPCMVAFSYLMVRTNKLTTELDQAAIRILDLIRQRYYAAELEQVGGGQHGGRGSHQGGNPYQRAL
jgi:biopolymer transport protein ExbB/TolQ